jgi:hypothetical protein
VQNNENEDNNNNNNNNNNNDSLIYVLNSRARGQLQSQREYKTTRTKCQSNKYKKVGNSLMLFK